MGLVKQVKVGNITNLSEARYCAGMGVDYLSFPASEVDPKTFQEITGWVSGPKFGVEIGTKPASLEAYDPEFVVLPVNDLDPAYNKVVVKVNTSDLLLHREKLILYKDKILFLELDLENELLSAYSLSTIAQLKDDFQIFVRYKGGDIQDYLQLHVDGISLDGNAEEKPGLKEYPLAEILEKMEEEL